jgi:hypothetical protein
MLKHALLASAAILAAGATFDSASAQFFSSQGETRFGAQAVVDREETGSVVQRDTFRQARTVYRPETVESTATVMRPERVRTRQTVNEQVQVPIARTEMQPAPCSSPCRCP